MEGELLEVRLYQDKMRGNPPLFGKADCVIGRGLSDLIWWWTSASEYFVGYTLYYVVWCYAWV